MFAALNLRVATRMETIMIIKMIPDDYIINATMQYNWGILQSDFVFKAIFIKNDTSKPIMINKIAFELNVQGKKIKEIGYSGEALELLINDFPNKIKYHSDWDSKVMIGKAKFWNLDNLAVNATLQPNQETN